jgi:hypothetical protein
MIRPLSYFSISNDQNCSAGVLDLIQAAGAEGDPRDVFAMIEEDLVFNSRHRLGKGQPPIAIAKPPARTTTAAMKSAISVGVIVQSLRILLLRCPFDAVARESAERDLQGEPGSHTGPGQSHAPGMIGDGQAFTRGTGHSP